MAKLSIRNLELNNKYVFVRVDFNVPLSDSGLQILDDTRIRETLPTLEYALRHHAKVIVASHLGRPKGKPNPKYSLRPVVDRLRTLLDHALGESVNVAFSPDCVGDVATELARQLESRQVLLLENLRFHAGEEANDAQFARQLASLCNVYVNDAFGSAHRAHASTEGITHFVSQSAAGLLLEKELNYLGAAISHPEHPYVVILGGAKVSDKVEVIRKLLPLCDSMLIGGAMVYTFLKARGIDIGKSLVEIDKLDLAKELLQNPKLKLPVDHVISPRIEQGAEMRTQSTGDAVPADWLGLDIGPAAIAQFSAEIAGARTVLWNGPMGVFEIDQFATGTVAIAKAVA